MCKPHKGNGMKGKLCYQTMQERRAVQNEHLDLIDEIRKNHKEDESI